MIAGDPFATELIFKTLERLAAASTVEAQLDALSGYARAQGATKGAIFLNDPADHLPEGYIRVEALWWRDSDPAPLLQAGENYPGLRHSFLPTETDGVFCDLVEDLEDDPDIDPVLRIVMRELRMRGAAFLCFNDIRQGTTAVLYFVWDQPHHFDENARHFYQTLAHCFSLITSSLFVNRRAQTSLQALQTVRSETEILYHMLENLTAARTFSEQLEAVSAYAKVCGATSGHLMLIDHVEVDMEWTELAAIWYTDPVHQVEVGSRFHIVDLPFANHLAVNHHAPLLVNDVTTDPTVDPIMLDLFQVHGVRAVAQLPLLSRDRWVGTIGFVWQHPQLFSETDARIYRAIMRHAAPVIDSTLLLEQTHRRAEDLESARSETEVIYRTLDRLTRQMTLAEQLDAISDYARSGGACGGVLFLIEEPEADLPEWTLVAAEWRDDPAYLLGVGTRLKTVQTPFSSYIKSQQMRPAMIDDVRTHSAVDPDSRALLEQFSVRALAQLPLYTGDTFIGVVAFVWDHPQQFTRRDERIYTALNQHAAPVIDTARLMEQRERRAEALSVAKQEMDYLYITSNRLARAMTPEDFLNAASRFARGNGACLGRLIYLHRHPDGSIRSGEIAAEWADDRRILYGVGTAFHEGIFEVIETWIQEDNLPLFVRDIRHDERFSESFRARAEVQNTLATAYLPLKNRDRFVALLLFSWPEPHDFCDQEERIYTALIQQAAPVIDSMRLMAQRERRARELEVAKNELEVVYAASRKLASARSHHEQLEAVSAYARSQGAMHGILFHMNASDDINAEWVDVLASWASPLRHFEIGSRLRFASSDLASYLRSRSSLPYLTANIQTDPNVDPAIQQHMAKTGIFAGVVLPLSSGGRMVGVIWFAWDHPYDFDERDERIYSALLNQAVTAVDSLRLLDQTRNRARELEVANNEIDLLYRASTGLAMATTADEILQAASEYPRRNGACQGVLFFSVEGTDEIELVAEWYTDPRHAIGTGWRVSVAGMDFARNHWMIQTDRPVIVTDALTDPRTDPITRTYYEHFGVCGSVVTPLFNKGRWVGVMTFNWSEPREFSDRDARIYNALTQHVAAIVDGMRLLDENRIRASRAEVLVKINTALSRAADEASILGAMAWYVQMQGARGLILNYADESAAEDEIGEGPVVAFWRDGEMLDVDAVQKVIVDLCDYDIDRLWRTHPEIPLLISDIPNDLRIATHHREALTAIIPDRAWAILPLFSGGSYQGLLTVVWTEPHTFSEEEQHIYHMLLQSLPSVVASRRAFLAGEEARRESEMLYRASQAINAANTLDEVMQAVEAFDPLSSGISITIWENYNRDGATYAEVMVASRLAVPHLGDRYDFDRFPFVASLPQDDLFIVEDALTDPRIDPVTAASWEKLKLRARISVPLTLHERWIGNLVFSTDRPRRYRDREKRLIAGVGELVASAVERIRLQQETEESRQRAETLARINAGLSQAVNEQQILAAIAPLADRCGVALSTLAYTHTDEVGRVAEVRTVALRSAEIGPVELEDMPLSAFRIDEFPLLQLAYENPGEPIFVEDISRDLRGGVREGLGAAETMGWPALIVLPLKTGDQWQGMLTFVWAEPQNFTPEIHRLFTAILPAAASVVSSRRAYLAARQRARELETVAKVSAAATSVLDVNELLRMVADLTRRNFVDYQIFVYLLDETLGHFVPAPQSFESSGIWSTRPMQPIEASNPRSLIARAGAERKGIIVNDIINAPDYTLAPLLPRARSEMAVPMVVGDRLIGVLDVQSLEINRFSEADIWVMGALADLLAVAVQNARLYQQAQELATLEERNRIARELHDSVSQALYGIALGSRTARALLDRDPSRLAEPLDYVLSLAEAGLTEMRALIFELRPESLENEGLVTALSKQAASLQARFGIQVDVDLCPEPALPLEFKESLYRIAREALHNIVKHAQATQIDLSMRCDRQMITLEVGDNGLGFDTGASFPGHMGLHSMRERTQRLNGEFHVESAPGEGTRITVRVPSGRAARP